jgi:hypothetical protein
VDLPGTTVGLAVFLILLLPGIVYATVRSSISGLTYFDADRGRQVLRAAAVGALLDGVYLVMFGGWLVDRFGSSEGVPDHPRSAAAILLVLGIAIPTILALIVQVLSRRHREGRSPKIVNRSIERIGSGYQATPTAWDRHAPGLGGHFVRVRRAEGKWIAGWYDSRSYISTYPVPRDIYMQAQWHCDAKGKIGHRVEGTAGVWLSVRDDDIVEWIEPSREE